MRRVTTVDLMLTTVVLAWAFNLTATRYIVQHGFNPLAYSTVRYGLAILLFGAITVSWEKTLRIRGGRDLVQVATAAGLLAANQACFVYALKFTTATTVALILGSSTIFAALFGAVAGLERITSRIVLAGTASFAGVALVVAGSGGAFSADVKGDLLALGMAATWSAYSVAIAPLMRGYSPYRISTIVLLVMWFVVAAISAPQVASQHWHLSLLVWLALAYAVLVPLVLTNILWFTAIDRIGPSRASIFANLQPFAAAIFSLLLLNEKIHPVQVAGGFAIAIGILLSRGPVSRASRAE